MKKKRTKTARRLCLILLLALALPAARSEAQVLGVKTNALGWGAWGTLNLGVDVGFAKQWTFEVDAFYNPFTWQDNKKTHIWGFQPEVRFWPRYKYAGHFLGLHGNYAQYDWGLHKYRYKGELWGGGISYGYAWMISPRWNIEATVGFGYTRLDNSERYWRQDPALRSPYYDYYSPVGPSVENKWGLTRAGISVTYFIK